MYSVFRPLFPVNQKEEDVNLSKDDWRARMFFWSLDIWEEFFQLYTGCGERTNLCHFVRVICVWMPLVLILHLALAAAAIMGVTVLPITLFGWTVWMVMAAIVSLIIGGIVIKQAIARRPRARRVEALPEKPPMLDETHHRQPRKRKPEGPSTWSIIWTWVVAQKQRGCPPVNFLQAQEEHRA